MFLILKHCSLHILFTWILLLASIYLSIYLSIYQSIYLSVGLSLSPFLMTIYVYIVVNAIVLSSVSGLQSGLISSNTLYTQKLKANLPYFSNTIFKQLHFKYLHVWWLILAPYMYLHYVKHWHGTLSQVMEFTLSCMTKTIRKHSL